MYKVEVVGSDRPCWRHLRLLKTFFDPLQLWIVELDPVICVVVQNTGCGVLPLLQESPSWCPSCVSRVNLLESAMTKCTCAARCQGAAWCQIVPEYRPGSTVSTGDTTSTAKPGCLHATLVPPNWDTRCQRSKTARPA